MKARGYTKETINSVGVFERNFPAFNIGDTIAISQKIKEGDKERTQVFQGDVIARSINGASSTFTVRKMGPNAVAVEKIFPYYAPFIEEIAVVKRGKVRRAKLFYLRHRVGKAARIEEDIKTREQRAQQERALDENAEHAAEAGE